MQSSETAKYLFINKAGEIAVNASGYEGVGDFSEGVAGVFDPHKRHTSHLSLEYGTKRRENVIACSRPSTSLREKPSADSTYYATQQSRRHSKAA